MDLYVERQCIDQMKAGGIKQFLLLFDTYFPDLYRYVARRIGQGKRTEEIVRLSFLDALGQIQNTPTDIGYQVWLYSLAKPRGWDHIGKIAKEADSTPLVDDPQDVFFRFEKMLRKLSLEEREILRLKFFEEVADGDVMTVLGLQEGLIGPKIYRVLKRAHFLLFGESDERQGVYFGELSGFLARVRDQEEIVIPEAFKLSLRADLANRIERKDFAIDVEPVSEKVSQTTPPFAEKQGSDDPAKIFVEAVREMKEEEEEKQRKDQVRIERQERIFDFIDRFKVALALAPAFVLVIVVAIFVINFVDFGKEISDEGSDVNPDRIIRGYPTSCSFEVFYEGIFTDREHRRIDEDIVNRLCEKFNLNSLQVVSRAQEVVEVIADHEDFQLWYKFVNKEGEWIVKEYEKTFGGDGKSGKGPRDKRGIKRSSV